MRELRNGVIRAAAMGLLLVDALACAPGGDAQRSGMATGPEYAAHRHKMVEQQVAARGVRDERVLAAMRQVRRHVFVPEVSPEQAYADQPHPIGHRQTISQPYIVGLMTELAQLPEDARVLEIGTGSGYQAAVLAQIARQVFTIEIVEPLAKSAAAKLAAESIDNVQVRSGDGYAGWPEAAPFDAILVTAAAPRIPPALLEQLKVGGRLVLPVDESETSQFFGEAVQTLEVHRRTESGFEREQGIPVRFVPMTGEVRSDR